MPRPDIILRKKRVSLYNGETSGSDFEMVTSEDPNATADIKMNARLANIVAGGGDGEHSEGDLKLNEKGGDIRVQITAQRRGRDDSSTDRVWLDGGLGVMELGDTASRNGIRIDAGTGADRKATGETDDILLSRTLSYDTLAGIWEQAIDELDRSEAGGLHLSGPAGGDGMLAMDWSRDDGLGRPGVLFASNSSAGSGLFSLGNEFRPGRIEVWGSGKSVEVKSEGQGELTLFDDGGDSGVELTGKGSVTVGGDAVDGELVVNGAQKYRVTTGAGNEQRKGLHVQYYVPSKSAFETALRITPDGKVTYNGEELETKSS